MPSTNCAYDLYRYGLRNRNAYMSALNQTAIRDQYIERFVTYLAGEEDNDANDPTLNMTCAANVQGPHRLARASAYANHVDRFYPSNIHQFVLVPGVGHSSTGMFRSPQGRSVIFIHERDLPDSGQAPRASGRVDSPLEVQAATHSPACVLGSSNDAREMCALSAIRRGRLTLCVRPAGARTTHLHGVYGVRGQPTD